MQRIRIKFSRGDEIKHISHLDIMRLFSRAFRRMNTPLALSEGFSPHPKISIANPLAIGVTSEAELMDVTLLNRTSLHIFYKAVSKQLPNGIDITEIEEVPVANSSLQSQLRYAEYQVNITTSNSIDETKNAINRLLDLKILPWQHMRDTGPHCYDLRSLIDDLWIVSKDSQNITIGMRLRSGSNGAGRPEQVTAALGINEFPDSIHRTKLILA